MNKFFDEQCFRQVMKSAKNCRMEQLESDFAAWKEYVEVTAAKAALMNQMEELLPDRVKKMLWEYDDISALLVGRAQDFFYDQGFTDCLNLIKRVWGEAGGGNAGV